MHPHSSVSVQRAGTHNHAHLCRLSPRLRSEADDAYQRTPTLHVGYVPLTPNCTALWLGAPSAARAHRSSASGYVAASKDPRSAMVTANDGAGLTGVSDTAPCGRARNSLTIRAIGSPSKQARWTSSRDRATD